MPALLSDHVTLLTGAAGGVGNAVARLVAAQGGALHLVDLGCDLDGSGSDTRALDALVDELRDRDAKVSSQVLDVGVRGSARAAVDAALAAHGRLDAVVQCAGIHTEHTLRKLKDEEIDRVFDVHVRGAFELARSAADAFIARSQGGAIILSIGHEGFFGAARQSHLAAASGAVAGMVRSASLELRKWNVSVNAVAPLARTRITESMPLFRGVSARSLTADAAAPLYVYLMSERGRGVSGEILGIAGGRIHSFQHRQTTGAFVEGRAFEIEEIEAVWDEITRG
jgi:NAD(P)-dependent dehydrogenase (short-subunit alcohol dehydrogenase family)